MPGSVVVRVITGSESYGAILHTTKTANLTSIPLSAMKVYDEKTYNSTHSRCRYGMVAQWLGCCATYRKVAVSIPASVSGFFIDIKSFRSHYGPGIDSASNRNEYHEYFLRVKAVGA